MGVVYKLTEDVKNFIIEIKKANKKASCRFLADLASETFHVKVSKSSVNNVLKQAFLSDSVGRKPGKSPSSKKFQIPKEKKQDLAESLKKSLKTLESKPSPKKTDEGRSASFFKKSSILDSVKDNNILTKKDVSLGPTSESVELFEKKRREKRLPQTEGDLLNPVVSKDLFLEKFNNFRQQRDSLKGDLVSGLGYVFLKAAQWELFGSQGVSGLFDGKIFFSLSDVQENLERMFIFEILGNKFLENAGSLKKHFLCKVSDIEQGSFTEEDLASWTKSKKISLEGRLSYLTNLEVSLVRVAGYCLLLEDGTKLFLDSRCQQVELGQIRKSQSLSLNLALIQVSKNIIGGGGLFLSSSSEKALWEHAQMCQNVKGKKLKKISVFDLSYREITSFSIILDRKRSFCIIDWILPENKEIWIDKLKWAVRKPFYHFLSNKGYCYSVIDSGFLEKEAFRDEKGKVTSVVVWKQGDLYPFVCLSYVENDMDVECVLKKFLEKNIFSKKDTSQENNFKNIAMNKDVFLRKTGLWNMLRMYVDILKEHCAKNYFNMETFLEVESCFRSALYTDLGYFFHFNAGVAVDLLTSISGKNFVDLSLACERVNQRSIRDKRGRILSLNLIQL